MRDKASAVTAANLMTRPPGDHRPRRPGHPGGPPDVLPRRVKRLPVINDHGRLIGIVSRADVLSVYSRPDADIQREITQDLILGMFLCDPVRFTVAVKDGIVTVAGTPETAPVGRDIVDAARHVATALSPCVTGSATRRTRLTAQLPLDPTA